MLLMFAAIVGRLTAYSNLSDRDIIPLKTICDQIARGSDLQLAVARSKGGILRPYLQPRKPNEAEPGIMTGQCPDKTHSAELAFRGDVKFEFKWPNFLKRPSDIPITSVRLLRHGRVVYVARKPSNEALQPTADLGGDLHSLNTSNPQHSSPLLASSILVSLGGSDR